MSSPSEQETDILPVVNRSRMHSVDAIRVDLEVSINEISEGRGAAMFLRNESITTKQQGNPHVGHNHVTNPDFDSDNNNLSNNSSNMAALYTKAHTAALRGSVINLHDHTSSTVQQRANADLPAHEKPNIKNIDNSNNNNNNNNVPTNITTPHHSKNNSHVPTLERQNRQLDMSKLSHPSMTETIDSDLASVRSDPGGEDPFVEDEFGRGSANAINSTVGKTETKEERRDRRERERQERRKRRQERRKRDGLEDGDKDTLVVPSLITSFSSHGGELTNPQQGMSPRPSPASPRGDSNTLNMPTLNYLQLPLHSPKSPAYTLLGPRVEPPSCNCGTAECVCGLRLRNNNGNTTNYANNGAASPNNSNTTAVLQSPTGSTANAQPLSRASSIQASEAESVQTSQRESTNAMIPTSSQLNNNNNNSNNSANPPTTNTDNNTNAATNSTNNHNNTENVHPAHTGYHPTYYDDEDTEEDRRNLEHFELLKEKAKEVVEGAASRYSKQMTLSGRHAFCSSEDLYNFIMTPHDSLLMSHIAKPLLRIVDCRSIQEFSENHVRGAMNLMEASTQCARTGLNLTSHFQQRAAALDPRNTIVFYSHTDATDTMYSRQHASMVQAIALVDDGVSRLFTLKGGIDEFKLKFPFLICSLPHDLSLDMDEGNIGGTSPAHANLVNRSKRKKRTYGSHHQLSPREMDMTVDDIQQYPRNHVWFCPFSIPRSELPHIRTIAAKHGLYVDDAMLNGYYQNGHKIPGTSCLEFDPDLNVYPNLILDSWLLLGDQRCSWSLASLIDLRITHIINISTDICNYFEDHPAAQLPGGGFIKYLTIRLHDDRHSDIQSQFDMVCNFIDMAKKTDRNARIMVHCQMGISRSASLVIAYIMHLTKCSLKDVYYYVKTRRYIVQPNSGFWLQLANSERHHRGVTTVFDVMEAGLRRQEESTCNCCSLM